MLRKDVLYMLNQEWEPKVPSAKIMREQFLCFSHRISGFVKLAGGYIDDALSLKSESQKVNSVNIFMIEGLVEQELITIF